MPKLKQYRIVSTQLVSYEYFVEAESEEDANDRFDELCDTEEVWEKIEVCDEMGLEYSHTDEMDEAISLTDEGDKKWISSDNPEVNEYVLKTFAKNKNDS